MPLQKLQFRPGVNREGTTLTNEGGWFECDKIRFRSGTPEKIGGWQRLSSSTFLGTCRALWNWITLSGYNLCAVGTDVKYYIENGGTYYDITPIRETTTGTATFAASNGSSTITVTDPAHGAIDGDYVTFSGAVSLGGNVTATVLNQEYRITYVSASTYTITVSVVANGSDSGNGGGAVVAAYQLNNGVDVGTTSTGWGAGEWGGTAPITAVNQLNGAINAAVTTIIVDSTTGFPTTGMILIDSELITYTGVTATDFTGCTRGAGGTTAASHLDNTQVLDASGYTGWGESASTTSGSTLRLWSETNYGQDLIFNPRGGALYYWANGSSSVPALSTRGTLISGTDVPAYVLQVLLSDATRITIAFGCNDFGAYGSTELDPMLVRWTDSEDYTLWTPDATNQAGSYRLSHGSNIVCAVQNRQENVILTDSSVYSMQYIGPPYVWGFTLLADNTSVAGPNTMVTANGVVYWMGRDKFYIYGGRVETLPCTLRQYVFGNMNTAQSDQFFAGVNEGFSEVWWFYCSADSTVIDRYVIYNYLENVWYYGTMGRTAWLDSGLRAYPMAATYSNNIDYHEAAVDDNITDLPAPIESYLQSSDFDIGDGHTYGFVWRMVPDVSFDGSTSEAPEVTFEVRPRQNPGAAYGTANSPEVTSALSYASVRQYNVQQFTQIIYTRVRGRQMALKISSSALGTQWQLGAPRIDARPDGRR